MKYKTFQAGLLTTLIGLLLMLPQHVRALTIADSPLFLTGSVQPLVMLNISKDQQLYKKAFNDYSDLDGDGHLETTYKHSINYYGYFDSGKCYTYDSTDKRFEPASVSATKKCSGQWSGNFLNWASMARMDAVRKLLYGGLRSPDRINGDGNGISDGDTASSTVLERVFLPNDAHSWAKYYDGDGGATISEVTPYTPPTTTTASSTSRTITNPTTTTTACAAETNATPPINTVSYNFTLGSATGYAVNDYVQVTSTGSGAFLKGRVAALSGSDITLCVANGNYAGSGTHNDWSVDNLSKRGITLCNTTLGGSSPQDKSQTNTNLPRLRVAKGNFSLWNANERWQCRWSGEATASNSNNFAYSGVPAAGSNPSLVTHGTDATGNGLGDFFVRVQACVNGLIESENCKEYTPGNFKPIGLLQVYGDPDQIHFGLMTGSYDNNISGGVLRKNSSTFTDEVNANGTFTSVVGIVKTLDRMRIYGYNYGDGTYTGGSGDNCGFQLTSITEGNCTSWGNPMSELYYESLRYFAGASSPTPAYTSSSTKDAVLGLPRPGWVQPLSANNYCAPLNSLVFNASVSTNDFDLATVSMSNINSASTAAALADLVGTDEGIAGGSYFIGSTGTSGAANNELCDAKTVGNLGSIKGICPEGPTLLGSYLMPGMAYHARTNKIRTDLTVPASDTKSLKVATYGIQLATNVPRIPITLSGEPKPRVILQPIYRLNNSPPQGGGSLVDMKILDQTVTATTAKGTIYVNWEDSEQGGDYDQDMWGVIRYCLTTVANGCGTGTAANTLTVTTDAIAESTNQPQGFGYTTSGTTNDGPHFHSGIESFNYTDPTSISVTGGSGHINTSGGCASCATNDVASTATYTLNNGIVAKELKDPLYYAAKWGGFNDSDSDGKPNLDSEWDVLSATGASTPDSIPDNYFLVSNPLRLETALNSAFLKILKDSSASAVATSSSTLNTSSRIFQGRFSSSFWNGQFLSFRLDPLTGKVISAGTAQPSWWGSGIPYPEWDAGQKLAGSSVFPTPSTDNRVILTRSSSGTSVDFYYSNLDNLQKGKLDKSSSLQQDNCGPERVGYLRGHSVNEGTGALNCATAPVVAAPPISPQKFRSRSSGSVLGDIINSNPSFVGPPAAGYSDVDHPGYSAFRTSFKDRTPVVYVGANDGMLHGFDASVGSNNSPGANAGNEVIAYVPSPVFDNLSRLTDSNYVSSHRYFVDGSPMMADTCVSATSSCSSNWKTVLIGGLGAGGKGFYALNVTNPLDASKDTAATPMFSSSTNKANILMWEFPNANDTDLGLTYNTSPTKLTNNQAKQIVKFENSRWGVVVGNGYNSTSGKAALYILFLSGPSGTLPNPWTAGGVDFVKIEADAGPDNGLSTPIPFDSDGDGLADTVYAGDLKGNVWKFDLSSSSASSWAVAYGGAALFSAGASKPITTPPEISLHPNGGSMVMIGTGRYLGGTDSTSTDIQSFYGIHDHSSVVLASDLAEMKVKPTTIGGNTFRLTEPGCDNLPLTALPACPASVKGWYMDLPAGERVTGSPKLENGKLFFNTFIPSVTPCDFGGDGWLMAVGYLDGSTLADPTFDTDGSNTVNAKDGTVAGVQVGAALGGTTLIKASPGTAAAAAAAAGAAAAIGAASAADAAAAAAATTAGASSAAAADAGAAASAAAAGGASAAATGAAAAAAAAAAGATAAQAAAIGAAAAAVISTAYTNAASAVAATAIATGGGAAVSSLTTGGTSSQQTSFGAGSVGRINWREIIQ